jgi:hypothetical protein
MEERSFKLADNSKITVNGSTEYWENYICAYINITDISDDLMSVIIDAVEQRKRELVELQKLFPNVRPLEWGKTEIKSMTLTVSKESTTIRTSIDVYFEDEEGNGDMAEISVDLTGYETALNEIILDGVRNFLQM